MTSDHAPIALWVVPVAELGGVARHVLDATRVGIPGWRLVVLCPEGALADRLRAQDCAVVTGPFGPNAGFLASRRTLARTARALRPAIVHSHLAYADIVNAWTCFPAGTRRFTTEHGIAGDDRIYHASNLRSRLMALVHRARFHRFAGVIAVSRATRAAMIRKWKVRRAISVIPNGVDTRRGDVSPRHPSSKNDFRLLALSRIAVEKRLDILIEAFALIATERPEATLTIAGDGDLRPEMESLSRRLGVADRVSFPGHVDAGAAMDAADLLVQLSVWENCSYTLLDAQARGLPVLAADVGGNGEILPPEALVSRPTPREVADRALAPLSSGGPIPMSVAEMCAAIVGCYDEEFASRTPARGGLGMERMNTIPL